MTENERELINIIKSHSNPKQAVELALNLMLDFLAKHEVPQDTSSEPRQEAV